jgi:hypothetical protein
MNPANGLSVTLTNNPVVDSGMGLYAALTSKVESISFTSEAQGGYLSAEVTFTIDRAKAFDLLSGALGKRLVAQSPLAADASLIAWEGMVHSIFVDDGASPITRTLASTYNRVEVLYATVDTSTTPPTVGVQARTAQADSAGNQALYGIRHLVYPIGGATSANAVALRDSLLNQYARARASAQSIRRGGNADSSQGVAVTITAVGFIETLDKRIWRTTAATATATLDTLIKAILAGVGQFVNSDQSNIAANTYSRTQYFDQDVTAKRTIDLLCALGDGVTGRRCYFGIYENRKPHYFVEPTAPAYIALRLDGREIIRDATTGAEVPFFLVKPGRIIKFSDFVPDAVTYNTALDDVRAFLIGSVRYIAPNLLELTPVTKDASQITIVRMGLSEIG